jgi:SAM-dependent methyltransferase
MTTPDPSLQAMAAYYAQRATVYERVYHRPHRQADLRTIEAWLADAMAGRRVLEIACGTGWWPPHGARRALSWLATDLSPETLAIARSKPLPSVVEFATMDAYALDGLDGRSFDAAFAGFWWSHVPLQLLPAWLERLHALLPAGARIVFLDNAWVDGDSTPMARVDAHGNGWQRRILDDGSVHEVLKNFPTREQTFAMLGARAESPRWIAYDNYWILDYTLS